MTHSPKTSIADPGSQRLAGRLQIVLVVGVLLFAIALNRLLIASGEAPNTEASLPTAAPVEIIVPEPISERIEIEATGVVQVRAPVSIIPQVSGRIVSVSNELASGGRFTANQTLFEVDPTDYQLAVDRAQAEFRSVEAALALELAEAEIAQVEWQMVNGDEPIPALVAREPQLAQAEASVAAQQSRLDEAFVALERTRYSLPFDGRVTASDIELGQTVNGNAVYGSVYPAAAVEVIVSLSAEQAAKLDPLVGRAVNIRPNGQDRSASIPGEVIRIGANLDDRTRLLDVIIKPGAENALLPGQFIDATLMGDSLSGLFRLAVETVGPDDTIWVVEGDQLHERRPLIVSRGRGEILTRAFDVGDGVVRTRPPDATAGQSVRVLPSTPTNPELMESSSHE
ncbi:MAG: HlyD family efflux transporter periplasmic adaptor subunit [Pseudomonadota bacterium]